MLIVVFKNSQWSTGGGKKIKEEGEEEAEGGGGGGGGGVRCTSGEVIMTEAKFLVLGGE